VFWRDTGTNEDEDDVEAREGACSMETAMFWGGCRREGDGQEAVTLFVRAVATGRHCGIAAVGPVQRKEMGAVLVVDRQIRRCLGGRRGRWQLREREWPRGGRGGELRW